MKQLTILVPEGENNLSSIVGAYKIFSRANAYRRESGKPELFRIELAGLSAQVDFYGGLFSVKPHKNVSTIAKADLIIIPSLNHNYAQSVKTTTADRLDRKTIPGRRRDRQHLYRGFPAGGRGHPGRQELFDALVGGRRFQKEISGSQPAAGQTHH